jgi:Tol biopolymer transport system component
MDFPRGLPELWARDFTTGKDIQVVSAPAAEGRLSPDGKWLAFTATRPGGPVVFAQPFPGGGARVQISDGSGTQPHWSPDGKEVFYVSRDKDLMAVAVRTIGQSGEGTLEASAPRRLFRTRMHSPRYSLFQYDVSPDGKRFLINSLPREDAAAPLTLVTDWTTLGK